MVPPRIRNAAVAAIFSVAASLFAYSGQRLAPQADEVKTSGPRAARPSSTGVEPAPWCFPARKRKGRPAMRFGSTTPYVPAVWVAKYRARVAWVRPRVAARAAIQFLKVDPFPLTAASATRRPDRLSTPKVLGSGITGP